MANVLETFTAFNSSLSIFSARRRPRIMCDAASQVSPKKAGAGATGRSFGRLKVQRVKDIVKESSRKKKQGSGLEEYQQKEDDESYNDPDLSDQEEYIEVQKDTLEAFRSRAKSSARVATSSKRWGGVESADSYRYTDAEALKKGLKITANNDFFSRKSFNELGCSDYIVESLRKLQFVRPSHIQAMAFESIIGGRSCIIADQSGSGKTLSYLIPLVQRLRQEEIEGLSKSASQNPRAIILVPTAELASQVLNVCRSLSKVGVPFRSMVATGGFRQKTQLDNLKQGIDVLIATPGRLMFLVKEGHLQLSDIRSAILDEVDILYNDEDFEQALQILVELAPVTAQYLFVTATLPVEIYYKLVEVFPDCEVIMGPGVHRTSSRLEEVLIDCSGDENSEKTPDTAFLNKKNALIQLAEQRPVTKTIVFCNKIETCRKVENALKRLDRKEMHAKVLPFHAALDQESRVANIEEFRRSPLKNMSLFLVCTDRASRGIDFAGVDHVILFDFPRDPSEYVRRVGRTARAGGQGKAFVFAVGKQVSLARRIIERNLKGHPLHDVPSSYEAMR